MGIKEQAPVPSPKVDAPQDRWPSMVWLVKATITVAATLTVLRLLVTVGDILVLILVALVLAIGLQPTINWLERRGLSRGWGMVLVLVAGLAVVSGFIALLLPVVVRQVGDLIEAAPGLIEQVQSGSGFLGRISERFDLATRAQQLAAELPAIALTVASGLATLVIGAITVLVLTIYFAVALPRIRRGIARLLHREGREDFEAILDESIQRVGNYILGNLVISVIAGVASFLALFLLGVPFAAALAFAVALLDLIPLVGAMIAALISTLVASSGGLFPAIGTLLFFLVYQQVENHLIQPRVMRHAIDMSFGAVIVAVLIGGKLLGVMGALLALPVAAILKALVYQLYLHDRLDEVRAADRRFLPWRRRPVEP